MNFKLCYIGGDILAGGRKYQRQHETKEVESLGINVYNPIDQKDINDKKNQTIESNKYLCDKIVKKDTDALRKADLVIFDADNNSVGTTCEIGQMYEFAFWREEVEKAYNSENPKEYLKKLMDENPRKTFYFHSSDLRFTELPEQGAFRSWSLNQYLHGLIRGLSKHGLMTFDKVLEKLKLDVKGDSK